MKCGNDIDNYSYVLVLEILNNLWIRFSRSNTFCELVCKYIVKYVLFQPLLGNDV